MLAQPHIVIDELPIKEGDTVIDCGAGVGSYALLLAQKVGRLGHVHAYDIQSGLVAALDRNAKDNNLNQIIALTVDFEKDSMPLQNNAANGALIAHTLFQIGDKRLFLKEVARVLKPGAWLAVVEWRDSFQGIGPQPDYIVPEEQVHTLCDEAGFLFVKSLAVGSFQYAALFKKI